MFSRTTIKFLKGEHFKRENENIILTGVIDGHLKKNELKKNGKELGIKIFFILLMKSCTLHGHYKYIMKMKGKK
jgi:hypothetical protein